MVEYLCAIDHRPDPVVRYETAVIVAHRLSTVKDADLIYVLHQGRVVEQGTHAELLALDGRYAALWRAQTEGHAALPAHSRQEELTYA